MIGMAERMPSGSSTGWIWPGRPNKDQHLRHSKSNAKAAEHRQNYPLPLRAQKRLADEVEDRSLLGLSQHCSVKYAEEWKLSLA